MVKKNEIHNKKSREARKGTFLRIGLIIFIICYIFSIFLKSINKITLAEILETWCFIFLLLYIGFLIIGVIKNRSVHRINKEENEIIEKLALDCLKNSQLSYTSLLQCISKKLDYSGIFFITQRQIMKCIDSLLLEKNIFEKNGYFCIEKNSTPNEVKNQDKNFFNFRKKQKIQRLLIWGFLGFPLGIMIWIIGASGSIKIPGYVQIGYILIFSAFISVYLSVWLLGKINK